MLLCASESSLRSCWVKGGNTIHSVPSPRLVTRLAFRGVVRLGGGEQGAHRKQNERRECIRTADQHPQRRLLSCCFISAHFMSPPACLFLLLFCKQEERHLSSSVRASWRWGTGGTQAAFDVVFALALAACRRRAVCAAVIAQGSSRSDRLVGRASCSSCRLPIRHPGEDWGCRGFPGWSGSPRSVSTPTPSTSSGWRFRHSIACIFLRSRVLLWRWGSGGQTRSHLHHACGETRGLQRRLGHTTPEHSTARRFRARARERGKRRLPAPCASTRPQRERVIFCLWFDVAHPCVSGTLPVMPLVTR